MSAMGQGGGGGGAPAAGGAPAGTGAPAPTQPQNQPSQPNANDPWGFAQHVANAPEHLRDTLQTILNDGIAPQLQQRMAPYEPLQSRMEQLSPLLAEPDENGHTTLDGLLTLYQLMNGGDETADDFNDWWERVGDEFGFFDDEPGGGNGAPAASAAAAPAAPGQPDLSALDPNMRTFVESLQQTVEDLGSRLGEFESRTATNDRERQVSAAAEQIRTELTTAMKSNQIDGAEDIQSQQAQDILKLARAYGADPEAVTKGVADYLRITGGAQSQQLAQQGQQLNGVEALQAALAGGGNAPPRPGPALGAGGPSHQPENVQGFDDAKKLAMQRFTAAHGRG